MWEQLLGLDGALLPHVDDLGHEPRLRGSGWGARLWCWSSAWTLTVRCCLSSEFRDQEHVCCPCTEAAEVKAAPGIPRASMEYCLQQGSEMCSHAAMPPGPGGNGPQGGDLKVLDSLAGR